MSNSQAAKKQINKLKCSRDDMMLITYLQLQIMPIIDKDGCYKNM